ncbi:MAG: diacylglycerol kinase family lipid kinase [Firmicutes bacterium]|nr:diacylglycerol kinase family lipid kinase [Bacillota bacterium]
MSNFSHRQRDKSNGGVTINTRALIIYNPAAGNGKAERIYHELQPKIEALGIEVQRTERPGHATELARAVADDENMTVISLGGDGTHHEVINGLMPQGRAIFGVIPAGTGNDLVRVLNYPKNPLDALDVVLNGLAKPFDIGQVGDHYFLTVAGVGFDAEVAGWVNQRKKQGNGTWVFIRGILHNLIGYRSQMIKVTLTEASRTERTFLIAVGNTQYYAGGMKICPEASPFDGRFQVVWVGAISPLGVLPLLARVFRGNHVNHRKVKVLSTPELTVEGPPNLWVHADGELIGHLPITIRTLPQAIRVQMGVGG